MNDLAIWHKTNDEYLSAAINWLRLRLIRLANSNKRRPKRQPPRSPQSAKIQFLGTTQEGAVPITSGSKESRSRQRRTDRPSRAVDESGGRIGTTTRTDNSEPSIRTGTVRGTHPAAVRSHGTRYAHRRAVCPRPKRPVTSPPQLCAGVCPV